MIAREADDRDVLNIIRCDPMRAVCVSEILRRWSGVVGSIFRCALASFALGDAAPHQSEPVLHIEEQSHQRDRLKKTDRERESQRGR